MGPSIGIGIAFGVTAVGVAAAIVALVALAAKRAGRDPRRDALRVGGAIGVWLAATAALAASGAIAFDGGPPKALALPWIAIVAGVVALWRPAGRTFLASVPRPFVVGLQGFRVPVELVLWALFLDGAVPERMTFEGRNLDVLVGLTALPVGFAAWAGVRRRPWLALAWHVAGLALLANIVSMAIRAQPPVIPTVPYIWLPAFLVPIALLGHIAGIAQARAALRA
jgi:hypothetical protein